MATEAIERDRFQKVYDELEAQKTVITNCTELWKNVSNHFSSLEDSLLQKSKLLESKLETLDSETKKALEALEQREISIPERESAAFARIEELKEAALLEFEKTATGNVELAEALRSYCRKMDSSGLLRFLAAKRKETMYLRTEISLAIAESVDPPRLVLDALEDFISQKYERVGVPDRRWACGMLLHALFPATESGGKTPAVAGSIAKRAAGIAEAWKGKMDDPDGGMGPAEAAMFLQMVIGFGLRSRFEEEFLVKLVLEYPSRRDMPKFAAALRFGEKMGVRGIPGWKACRKGTTKELWRWLFNFGLSLFSWTDLIDELVKSGKEIEAVYFASECGLTERFPPVSLLKNYLRNSRKNAATLLKNGHYNVAATDEASALELTSIRAIIKCVEDHSLESDFTIDSLRKRVSQLEKAKSNRKKSAAAASKPPNKRAHSSGGRGSGPPSFRPAKAGRFSNDQPSFGRRNAAPGHQNPAARYSGPYNYPNQSVYEASAPTSYSSAYGGRHAQSPAALPQHYSFTPEDIGVGGVRPSGSYGGQTNYGAYEYGIGAPPTYQPSYTQ
ncbi:hypothetical protein HHK36_021586 [Tetracentron sinense]|uniref:FRIGIDA-like protein n=1 Tax=Tetracentron sinense TaxID=13715 RepID=A0A835D7I0_TETSI|nr:hypothetical protein HHK36_021586 [Tetracentron sinense]